MRQVKKMHLARLLLLAISLIVSLAVFANVASSLLTQTDPALALRINPFNSEARIKLLTETMVAQKGGDATEAWSSATRGSSLEPVDARYVSLLGIIHETQDRKSEAIRHYEAALRILPVEIQALSREFIRQVETGHARQAIISADTIFRRWPQFLEIVTPQLPVLLSDREGYDEALERFARVNGGKNWLINQLSDNSENMVIANRLILDWKAAGEMDLRKATNTLTARLARNGQVAAAYQLFLSTLSEDEKSEGGYIYNGNFALDPNGNLFDWRFRNRSGMGYSIIDLPSAINDGVKKNRALSVRFLNSPVRFNSVVTHLRLPPSVFRLAVNYSARSLKGPQPVRLSLECVKGNTPLATIEFGMGTVPEKATSTEFRIPAENCGMQQIRLMNDNFVESWRNQYSGTLLLHSASIERIGA